jgi:hypothetical protein
VSGWHRTHMCAPPSAHTHTHRGRGCGRIRGDGSCSLRSRPRAAGQASAHPAVAAEAQRSHKSLTGAQSGPPPQSSMPPQPYQRGGPLFFSLPCTERERERDCQTDPCTHSTHKSLSQTHLQMVQIDVAVHAVVEADRHHARGRPTHTHTHTAAAWVSLKA